MCPFTFAFRRWRRRCSIFIYIYVASAADVGRRGTLNNHTTASPARAKQPVHLPSASSSRSSVSAIVAPLPPAARAHRRVAL